ncbi:MAG: hypothetical protein ACHQT8_01570 [Chlamydiales bacterium]
MNRAFLIVLLLLTSCGYRFQGKEEVRSARTLTVPYVKGDAEGLLTNALIKQLSISGYFECVRAGGDLTLDAVLISDENERIGYRYDRHGPKSKRRHRLVPDENRRTATVQISLIDSRTNEILLEPTKVFANIDYDYIDSNTLSELLFIDAHGVPRRTISYSLGQLDAVEGAQDDSTSLVFRLLSQKIVQALIYLKL